uniref:acyl carrier protein n=1 Tax=Merotricha bacillata TaxID=658122 RepID=UPI002113D7F5|nr:acyl carrier protein [Merotricha bacillata]UTE94513.1 acyl carrier protein [Merotricha bacillata]
MPEQFSSFSEVLTKVRQIVVDQFCLDSVDDLDNNAYFMRDLGADSLDVVELVMMFEEQFDIRISDEYVTQIKTVQEAAEVIAEIMDIEVAL